MPFVSHCHQSNFAKQSPPFKVRKASEQEDQQAIVLCGRQMSGKIPPVFSLWELHALYSQHRCGKVDEKVRCMLLLLG
jgi:hypothetical protein